MNSPSRRTRRVSSWSMGPSQLASKALLCCAVGLLTLSHVFLELRHIGTQISSDAFGSIDKSK